MISRSGRIWGLIADQARHRGGPVTAVDACAAAVAAVEVTGAWLSAARNAEAGHLIGATDNVSERLAELTLTLGEGPALDAASTGGPVLASDLAAAEYGLRWPAFAPAALADGAMAIFVLPLRIGAIRVGVLGLYRDNAGSLSGVQLGDALIVAETATLLLGFDSRDGAAARPGGQPPNLARHRAEIDQATEMLTEQLSTSIDDAFVRLRAYAYANDLRLIDVARDIAGRRLRLGPSPRPSRTLTREVPVRHRPARVPHAGDFCVSRAEKVNGLDGQLLSETFVELTDTMVADFDMLDFLHLLTDRSVQLLDVSAAGLLLADPRGELRVVAASSEAARVLEQFQLQSDEGPCLECFRDGNAVTIPDLAAEAHRWPQFAGAAGQGGFAAVQALPMRLRDQVIGALNLFRTSPGPFDPVNMRIGQALADVATISLLHERSMRHSDALNEQLQAALNSRVVIEQAKGKVAERFGLDMNAAFDLLRDYARSHNRRLSELAQGFVDGTETITGAGAGQPRPGSPDPGRTRHQRRRVPRHGR